MDSIALRIDAVRERIAAAARNAGRPPEEVRLVGVTKTHPPEIIAQALAAGLTDFGENRVQEAEPKIAALAVERARITWHMIGHLQRNKAKKAAALFDVVHAIDSVRLAEALDRALDKETRRQGDPGEEGGEKRDESTPLLAPRSSLLAPRSRSPSLPVLIEVNVSGETSKAGFELSDWEEQPALIDRFLAEVEAMLALPHLRIRGLMTIAPWGDDPEETRPTFRSIRRLRDRLAQQFPQGNWGELSMGMTDDFEVAIEEGATLVRIGRAIFGEREPLKR